MPPPPPLPPLTLPMVPRGKGETKPLGTREFEGIKAEGTMTSHTIPAGQIGNEKALTFVSERWYSADLDMVLETRHSDPRFGETRFRVLNLERKNPTTPFSECRRTTASMTDPAGRRYRRRHAP
jgi:hypothetical protein